VAHVQQIFCATYPKSFALIQPIFKGKINMQLSAWQSRLVLSQLPHIGPILCKRLEAAFGGDLSAALCAKKEALLAIPGIGPVGAEALLNWRQHVQLEASEAALKAVGASFLIPELGDFPPLLKVMPDTPIGLYAKGPVRPTDRSIAIVGSRRASLYGLSVAKKLAGELAQLGFTVVSGMARGIDGAAHEGALASSGQTVAILGTGVDMVYPPEHQSLYNRLVESGAVFSEFPLSRPADRQTFPLRNRIIAGLCHATIVVESDLHGGSMITARLAGEYGRLFFAVPGRIDQASSRGCHSLIREGATLLSSIDDLLEELAPIGQTLLAFEKTPRAPSSKAAIPAIDLSLLSKDESCLLNILKESRASSIDTLIGLSGLSPACVSATLLGLELKKCILKRADGSFEAHA
jgi:DNA processing protein